MPYEVSGWIEVLWDWTLEEETQLWSGVINLDRFCFYGDDVTNKLFGLSKRPSDNAYFSDRGVPQDCSKYVAAEVERNEEFIKKYGEGDFGHTWALWSEIYPHLDELRDARDFPAWKRVFGMVQELHNDRVGLMHRSLIKAEWIRFVVWGNR